MTRYSRLTAGLVGAWFVFSLIASALHLYANGAKNDLPLALGLAVLTPIVVFVAWFAASPGLRQFTMSLNPRTLTMIHSWRVAGVVFLVLATYRILPRLFALPAGWGDIAMGATASFVALRLATPSHRRLFIAWQVLGMVDLVTAVALGTLARVIDPQGIPTNAMQTLPLSLIPTFAVPLLLILHILCIVQGSRWKREQGATLGTQIQPQSA
jgi:hypothetical protein